MKDEIMNEEWRMKNRGEWRRMEEDGGRKMKNKASTGCILSKIYNACRYYIQYIILYITYFIYFTIVIF